MVRHLKDYFKEEEGLETYVSPDGFFSYVYDESYKNFMIHHFFVTKSLRGAGTYRLFEVAKTKAKSMGAERLVGNLFKVEGNEARFTRKLIVHLKHGYEIADVNKNCITVMKEI